MIVDKKIWSERSRDFVWREVKPIITIDLERKNNPHLRKWRQNLLVHTALQADLNHHREFTLISCKRLDVAPRWRPHSSQILLNLTTKIYQHRRGDYHQRMTY